MSADRSPSRAGAGRAGGPLSGFSFQQLLLLAFLLIAGLLGVSSLRALHTLEQLALDDEGLRAEFDELTASLESRTHGPLLARLAGQPVSTGGWTLADGFARLWGAATLEGFRGRGTYRAVLAERLRYAAAHGARTAIVKGRVATSAPILERCGFVRYGEERAYRLDRL